MSYVYTTVPLPPIDTLNDHSGFWLFTIIAIIVWAIALGVISSIIIRLLTFIVLCGAVGAAAVNSWSSGDVRHYENRSVHATLVGFQAEGFNEARRVGGQTRKVDVHYTYVIYSVPGEGSVLFRAYPGISYPETAILYANKAAPQ